MLGQIANYCPIISRNTIVEQSTSIASIWQLVRTHFLDVKTSVWNLANAQKIFCSVLPVSQSTIFSLPDVASHRRDGEILETNEDISPSSENMIVLTWYVLFIRTCGPLSNNAAVQSSVQKRMQHSNPKYIRPWTISCTSSESKVLRTALFNGARSRPSGTSTSTQSQ